MRRSIVCATLALATTAVMVTAQPVVAEDDGGRPYRLELSGAEEFNAAGVPINPHGDADRGSVTLALNQGEERVCWSFGPITMVAGEALPHAAHIHAAPAGLGGPVVIPLFGSGGTGPAPTSYPTGTTCVHAPGELIKAIRHNPEGYYVNLHNVQHAGGVMRAQLG